MELLEQLEKEFGIGDKIRTADVTYNGHKYTLRALDYDDVVKANGIIFDRSVAGPIPAVPGAKAEEVIPDPFLIGMRAQFGFACVALAAIDDIPLWKVFKIATDDTISGLGCDPLEPPPRIRHVAADRFSEMIRKSKKLGLIEALYKVYSEKLDTDEVEPEGTDGNRPSKPS